MSHTDRWTRLGFALAAILIAAATLLPTGCSERAAATPKSSDTKVAETSDMAPPVQAHELAMADVAQEKPAAGIPVPNGPPEVLLQFIDDLQKREPQGNSPEALRAEMAQRAQAIVKAADKILATPQLDEQTRVHVVNTKIGGLAANLNDAAGLAALRKYVDVVAKDQNPALAASAQKLAPTLRRIAISMGDDSEAPAVLADIKARLSGDKIEMRELVPAAQAAEALETADPPELAIQAYALILKALDKVDPAALNTPQLQQLADQVREMAESASRRLSQIGKPLEIEGTLLDGKPFDWSKYRGKVVLVDFWATWCGPCVQELPNVKENYTRFHDKGFDVIGISLDESKEAVTEFLKQEEIPWPTLFSNDPKDQGWANPLVRRYDITGIPATFLVDRDGKVVSIAARGERLSKQLQRLLEKK